VGNRSNFIHAGYVGILCGRDSLVFRSYPFMAIILVMLSGIYVSDVYSKNRGEIDPKEVVIDEVVGTWIALYGYPPSYIIAGLFYLGYWIYLSPSQSRGAKKPREDGA